MIWAFPRLLDERGGGRDEKAEVDLVLRGILGREGRRREVDWDLTETGVSCGRQQRWSSIQTKADGLSGPPAAVIIT